MYYARLFFSPVTRVLKAEILLQSRRAKSTNFLAVVPLVEKTTVSRRKVTSGDQFPPMGGSVCARVSFFSPPFYAATVYIYTSRTVYSRKVVLISFYYTRFPLRQSWRQGERYVRVLNKQCNTKLQTLCVLYDVWREYVTIQPHSRLFLRRRAMTIQKTNIHFHTY